jgi:hypothetical protein
MRQDGEDWSGETREEDGGFLWWNNESIEWLLNEGMLWRPSAEEFKPWKTYKNGDGWWDVYSYYSIFQTLSLSRCLECLDIGLNVETLLDWSPDKARIWCDEWKVHAEHIIKSTSADVTHNIAEFCQVLASGYLPYAESDGATIAIAHPDFFDWDDFRRHWKADEQLRALGLSVADVTNTWRTVNAKRHWDDPLFSWRDFVDFIKPSQKEHLKGSALFGQTLRIMERILNLFQRDLSGHETYEFDGAPRDKEAFYGKGRT